MGGDHSCAFLIKPACEELVQRGSATGSSRTQRCRFRLTAGATIRPRRTAAFHAERHSRAIRRDCSFGLIAAVTIDPIGCLTPVSDAATRSRMIEVIFGLQKPRLVARER